MDPKEGEKDEVKKQPLLVPPLVLGPGSSINLGRKGYEFEVLNWIN